MPRRGKGKKLGKERRWRRRKSTAWGARRSRGEIFFGFFFRLFFFFFSRGKKTLTTKEKKNSSPLSQLFFRVHVTDALFGIAADDALGTLIARNKPCLLPEERLFVSFVEAHSFKVRRWLSRGGSGSGPLSPARPPRSQPPPPRSEQARLHWNRALSALVAWRATHRARAAAYLVPAAGGGGGDAPRRSTTGGTAGYGGGKSKRAGAEISRGGGSGSGDENAAPTPASVLLPAPSSSSDGEEEEEIRASFNKLMDGRIARTRASSIDGSGGGRGGGGNNKNLSDLFPQAA